METYEYESTKRDGTTELYIIPRLEAEESMDICLIELCGTEEAARELFNTLLFRRATTSRNPWVVGRTPSEKADPEVRKARLREQRAAAKSARTEKDALLAELLSAVKAGKSDQLAAILAARGIQK